MGYQALFFCPDEKVRSVVGQVFKELDFTVEPAHEPFAAVKKLMAQHYDAIVVDSDNEQNASLLFRSARNSTLNQASLAIALVEGQAGVAKAYRIGANLVLTKPINVEQAKGTLRVARGLLRKTTESSGASAAGTAANPNPASASATDRRTAPRVEFASHRPEAAGHDAPEHDAPEHEALPATAHQARSAALSGTLPATAATAVAISGAINNDVAESHATSGAENAAEISLAASSPGTAHSDISATPGSAAAPASAKEATAPTPGKNKTVEAEPANPYQAASSPLDSSRDHAPNHPFGTAKTNDAPLFAGLSEKDSGSPGSSKKMLIAAIIVLALAALGYFGYPMLDKSSVKPAPQPVSTPASAPQGSATPAPVLTPQSSPAAQPTETQPSTSAPGPASYATQPVTPNTATTRPSGQASAGAPNSTGTGNSMMRMATNVAAGFESAAKKLVSPLLVKSDVRAAKTQAKSEESAPPLPVALAVAPANESALSSVLSSSTPSVPTLAPQTVKVSQGVSQGLLIKQVQPKYPQAALAVHAQGAVQIEATISKEGIVTHPKVIKGDPILARAALEAVRQWRYKPYYLDGQPVEIQTQITVNFRTD